MSSHLFWSKFSNQLPISANFLNFEKKYSLGFSRVITVASQYLLEEITVCSRRIIQRTMIFCQKDKKLFRVNKAFYASEHLKQGRWNKHSSHIALAINNHLTSSEDFSNTKMPHWGNSKRTRKA